MSLTEKTYTITSTWIIKVNKLLWRVMSTVHFVLLIFQHHFHPTLHGVFIIWFKNPVLFNVGVYK